MSDLKTLIGLLLEQAANNQSVHWYNVSVPLLKTLDKSPSAKAESFTVFLTSDSLKVDSRWRPELNPYETVYVSLSDEQMQRILADTPGKSVQRLPSKPVDVNALTPKMDLKSLEVDQIKPGLSKKAFWEKPSGITPFDFLQQRVQQWTKILDDNKQSRTSKFQSLPKGTLFHATAQKLKVGDIIKPYWTEDKLQARGAGGMGFDYGSAAEDILEKGRPKDKPSRLGSVFAFETAQEASEWGSGRTIVAIAPMSNKIHRCDMRTLEAIVSTWRDTAEAVGLIDENDPDAKEAEAAIQQDSDERVKQFVRNYWAGKENGPRPRWEILIGGNAKVIMVE